MTGKSSPPPSDANTSGHEGFSQPEKANGVVGDASNEGTEEKSQSPSPKAVSQAAGPPAVSYPGPLMGSLFTISLLLAQFLVALDMSIITTAIPTISSEFHSVDQIGWYGSAFFLCLATFQAFWGRAYKYFSLKIAFLTCIGIFELGSLIAALSPTSAALIVGRAIQGVGGAGITSGCFTILAFITPPKRLHAIFGLSSTVWSLSSVLGPVLGGLFTQYLTWRWCFWINLPIGGAAFLVLLLLFKTPAHSRVAHATGKEIPSLFDIPGMVILVPSVVCLLLVLEEGGLTRPWNSGFSIGLIIGSILIAMIFAAWEWKQGEKAMLVPRILRRRTILVLALFNLTAQGGGFARTYNLPIYFQAGQGVSPSESGVRTLPTVLTTSIISFASSILVGKMGYYKVYLMVGAIFVTVGSGMIYTLVPESTAGEYIGYQVLAAIGSGLVIQLNVLVAQAISPRVDIAVTVAIVLFFQFLGGTIGVSAAINIMNNVIVTSLPNDNPRVTPATVLTAGAGSLRQAFPDPDDLSTVVGAYMNGLRAAWIWSIALSGIAFIISLGAEWKSVRQADVKKRNEAKAAAKAASP
ncbi:hypothetical protein JX265_012304 [Neoarthrinium moseri]|uniref:Major facilitator superfamily (MFS) profile domain-containing protein n=1 Tax=Neoarthrinium moseri TaxID=1658444 RepID=A0A9P9WB19_9PEZI|nr:hypothetical protein JX266_003358 [Neoarthrinium moseri]KAI1855116.1 hypothetical protein JX265_012304 [Neoarthrinium moseri]